MKYLIATDIHGSLYYGQKIIDAFNLLQADKIILLGDTLYHGPRNDLPKEYNPKELTNLLNQYKNRIISVKGNCDSDVDQMVLQFPIIAPLIIMEIKRNKNNYKNSFMRSNLKYFMFIQINNHREQHLLLFIKSEE